MENINEEAESDILFKYSCELSYDMIILVKNHIVAYDYTMNDANILSIISFSLSSLLAFFLSSKKNNEKLLKENIDAIADSVFKLTLNRIDLINDNKKNK